MKVYVVESKGVTPILLEVEAAIRFNIGEDDEAAILTLPKMWASSAKSVKCLIEDD
jgi:hypothetical protein